MDTKQLLSFLNKLEKLKNITRHSWTSEGRRESVAEHSWRLASMVCLLKDELKGYDIHKMITMALFHDLGEIKYGDVPGFDKTDTDVEREKAALEEVAEEYKELGIESIIENVRDFDRKGSKEARVVNALDKIEAVIQHNEADLKTWIEREYEMNLTYGTDECGFENVLADLRAKVRIQTEDKVGTRGEKNETN
ncbi:MAG: HD domain-containing protein [Chitinispirillaceae bacterium]